MTRAARRLANARKAWQHRVTRKLSDKAGTVVIERLNTRGMTRSARGTAEAPGTNVRAKAGLNREILNTGWAAMEQMLSYKAVELVRVPAAYTSQTCSACGVVDPDSRRTQSFHVRGLRLRTERGPECGPQRSGVGDWRIWTARGVRIANPYDPSNGYGNYPWVITYISRDTRSRVR